MSRQSLMSSSINNTRTTSPPAVLGVVDPDAMRWDLGMVHSRRPTSLAAAVDKSLQFPPISNTKTLHVCGSITPKTPVAALMLPEQTLCK